MNMQLVAPDLEPLYKTKEAMKYLRVSRAKFNRMLADGDLVGRKVGATWRFTREQLDQAMQPGMIAKKTEQGEAS